MTGVQRFLASHNNLVAEAVMAATSVRPASAVRRSLVERSGSGVVALTGPYTGHADTDIEVEIVAGGATPRASAPVFAGVGSGTLSVLDVDAGATAQALTLTLVDLGTATAAAGLAVEEVTIRARVPGSAGNSIRIQVVPDTTATATEWSLLADWSAGTAYQQGEQWSFGALPLVDGALDPASPRIQFGADPEVYRPYREYKDGAWRIGLSPALQRTVSAGTRVYAVTGGYDVTVTDGTISTTHQDVVTLYDLCAALAGDPLVEAAGVVVQDRAPGGMAAIDVPLRTSAWLLSSTGVRVEDVSVGATAPTETITVRCANADAVGDEVWSVVGSVSGDLGTAVSGVPFVSSAISLTVPELAATGAGSGRTTWRFNAVARTAADSGLPSVCVRDFRLGVNARPRSVTFTYRERMSNGDCSCNHAGLVGRIDPACLGLAGEGTIMDATLKARLTDLYDWRSARVAEQSAMGGTAPDIVAAVDGLDIQLIEGVASILGDCVRLIYADATALAEWDSVFVTAQEDLADFDVNRLLGVVSTQGDYVSGGSITGFVETQSASIDGILAKYRAQCDHCLILAGIDPKSDASTAAGDGCWRDDPTATHWWVDESGTYLPVFSNRAYVSAARSTGSGASADIPAGAPYSTREFGLFIAVGCTDRLKVGDQVTIAIDSVDGLRPYSVGDQAVLSVVAAGPAYLVGGVTGTDTLTWSVVGAVDGALADYALTAAEPAYAAAGVELAIHRGGIQYELGDVYTVEIGSAQYRWRRDGGGWSSAADIPAGQVVLADGLAVSFAAGRAPSWVDGDRWVYQVRQPYGPGQVAKPDESAWQWSGAESDLVVDLGGVSAIRALAVWHALPAGAGLVIEGGDGTTWSESATLSVDRAVAVAVLETAWSVTHLRVRVTAGTGGSVRWVWAGLPLTTTYSATRCRLGRAYSAQRGDGLNPRRQYLGQGQRGEIAWEADVRPLTQADLEALMTMLDHLQQADEPMVLVPHFMHPHEAALVRVDQDAIEYSDYFELEPDDLAHRMISLALPLSPVLL